MNTRMAGLPEIQKSTLGGDNSHEYDQDRIGSRMGRIDNGCPKDWIYERGH